MSTRSIVLYIVLTLPTRPWCESTLEGVCPLLLEDLPLPPDVPGGMPDYRRSLVTSFFYKFYLTVLSRLGSEPLPQDLVSATRSVVIS